MSRITSLALRRIAGMQSTIVNLAITAKQANDPVLLKKWAAVWLAVRDVREHLSISLEAQEGIIVSIIEE
jgi:uncharacterized protein YqfA (UPF0365 family)